LSFFIYSERSGLYLPVSRFIGVLAAGQRARAETYP
jgi:hypothetical protein